MSIQQILDAVSSFDGSLVVAPTEGSEYPEIAWGDYFCYRAPDGRIPANAQPYATITAKDYPGDTASRLGDGRWRVNIHVGRAGFERLIGRPPRDFTWQDFATPEVLMPHPVYGRLGWVAVVAPDRTMPTVLDLLAAAASPAGR